MMEAKNVLQRIIIALNNIMLVVCIVMMGICYFDTKVPSEDVVYTQKIEPFSSAVLSNGTREYYFDLQDYDYRYTAMMFYTVHQSVEVYNSGRLIYSFNHDGGNWTKSTGCNINFIEVNEKMLQLAVKITPMYEELVDQELTFYLGSAYQMYDEVLAKSMPKFIASMLIIIFSLILFVYYICLYKKQYLSKDLVYLAFFALFIGTWTVNETDAAALIFNNRISDSLLPYFCLMFVVPPFIMFFDSYLGIKSKYLKHIILIASMVETVACILLHFTHIREFRQTLPVMQAMLVIAALYMVGSVIYQLVKKNYSRRIRITGGGLAIFMVSIVGDIFNYYRGVGDSDKYGRYLFLIFIIMMAYDSIKSTYEIIEKGRRAKQLEVFALTDSMTGLFNRNAFESQSKATKRLDGVTVVVADANGLKACNDTYGHEAGDEYITIVADIFSRVYGKYGNCYRTGGDEFCCIIPSANQSEMERLQKLFLARVYTANLEGNHQYDIGVAIGYACYDSSMDEDFKSLLNRADASMYENKKKSKISR